MSDKESISKRKRKNWKFLKQQCELADVLDTELERLHKDIAHIESLLNFSEEQSINVFIELLESYATTKSRSVTSAIEKYLKSWDNITVTDVKKLLSYRPDHLQSVVNNKPVSYKTLTAIAHFINELYGWNNIKSSMKYDYKNKRCDEELSCFTRWLSEQPDTLSPADVEAYSVELGITTSKQRKRAEKVYGTTGDWKDFNGRKNKPPANSTIEERLAAGCYTGHQLLGVSPDAELSAIKIIGKKYKSQFHPDKGGNADYFRQIVEACEQCGV